MRADGDGPRGLADWRHSNQRARRLPARSAVEAHSRDATPRFRGARKLVDRAAKPLPHFGGEVSLGDSIGETKRANETCVALPRVIVWQIEGARKARRLTKAVMAARMGTSRAQLDRVLDARNTALTIETLSKAAAAVGKRIKFELVAA